MQCNIQTHLLLNSVLRKFNPAFIPVRVFYRQLYTPEAFILNSVQNNFFVSKRSFYPLPNFLFFIPFYIILFHSILFYHPTSFLILYLSCVTSVYPSDCTACKSKFSKRSLVPLISSHNCFAYIPRQSTQLLLST